MKVWSVSRSNLPRVSRDSASRLESEARTKAIITASSKREIVETGMAKEALILQLKALKEAALRVPPGPADPVGGEASAVALTLPPHTSTPSPTLSLLLLLLRPLGGSWPSLRRCSSR